MAPFLLSFKVLDYFWKDFTATWKIAWRCKEAAAVVGGWAMTESGDRGGTDQVSSITSPYVSPILSLIVDWRACRTDHANRHAPWFGRQRPELIRRREPPAH